VTLTTTGYGDIAPLHPYARSLANVEAIIGQIYPATLLAWLVTLELRTSVVHDPEHVCTWAMAITPSSASGRSVFVGPQDRRRRFEEDSSTIAVG
jgi:hypothetical protein